MKMGRWRVHIIRAQLLHVGYVSRFRVGNYVVYQLIELLALQQMYTDEKYHVKWETTKSAQTFPLFRYLLYLPRKIRRIASPAMSSNIFPPLEKTRTVECPL